MATKIFHPNVSGSGEICVNTLKKDWKSSYGIAHILVTVKCLLIYPNPESALDEEAGKLLLENYQTYCDRAKLITSIHATPRTRPVEFDTPSSSASTSAATSPTGSASTGKPTTPAPTITSIPTMPPPSAIFAIPVVTRKASSPVPVPVAQSLPLTSSPSKLEKESLSSSTTNKERHTSPSPLSTADANVGRKTTPGIGMGLVDAPAPTTKAVKRAATGGAATGAEKRKKALKRL
jgi:ubiquitin-conjugating enzyme E2 S